MTVLEHFADWASLTSAGDFPPLAFERAGLAFEDTIGCMIAGANDAATNSVRRSVAQWGTGGARAIGTQARLPASWAALINGTAAHALDFDDEFLPALTHASAVLVSALLALAEEHGSTGEGVLAAYIVGVELNAALGRGLIRSHYDAGWHATSTIGTIAAAGACARLMGLDQHQIANAMSLGVSVAAGCKAQFGSSAKPLHAGFAAQHAIESAKLAACGVEGNLDVLEGPMGFLDLYGGPSPAGWELPYQELGKPLAIVGEGLMAKRFPCCTATHRALDCFLRLRDEQAFTVADVDSLDIVVGYGHKRNLMYDLPETAAQARFSMHYCIAVAMISGDVTLSDFSASAVRRTAVHALLRLTNLLAHEPGAEQADANKTMPHEVTVNLRDGRRLHGSQSALKGSIHHPLSDEERTSKFNDCCQDALNAADIENLRTVIRSLGVMDSISALSIALQEIPNLPPAKNSLA